MLCPCLVQHLYALLRLVKALVALRLHMIFLASSVLQDRARGGQSHRRVWGCGGPVPPAGLQVLFEALLQLLLKRFKVLWSGRSHFLDDLSRSMQPGPR